MAHHLHQSFGFRLSLAAAVLIGLAVRPACADDGSAEPSADPHAHHHHMMQDPQPVTRLTTQLTVPDVTLVRSDGKSVDIAHELADDRPVLVNFIYTTCTTVCPLLTQTFAEVQKRLGADAAKVRMISISIDPEEDTPARLGEYARRYNAGPQWSFYTGTIESSIAVQRAFSTYRGDKMNHAAVTFYRASQGNDWVRMDGFVTPAAILDELRPKLAQK